MENIMRQRVMMILASAVLAASPLATSARAEGGGGFNRGMGGFRGGHEAGLSVGPIEGHVDEFDAGAMTHIDQRHLGIGRRHFVNGIYDYGSVAHMARRTTYGTPAPTE
jgi:hypothetical protein